MRTPASLVLALSLATVGCGEDLDTSSDGPAAAAEAPARVPTQAMIGKTLATVNGHPIGSREFDPQAVRRAGPAGDLALDDRMEVMQELVDEKLLYLEAVRRGLDLDPKVQKMMVNTLLKDEVYSSVRTSDIKEDALRQYFEEHKDEFVVHEKLQVQRILIKPKGEETPELARQRAEEIRAEVQARPGDFKTLAQQHSQGPFKRRGGDMGYITPEGKPGVDPAVVEQAFTLGRGDVSEVFETRDGWNIVYIAGKRDRVERTFEQMRGSVLRKVKAEKYRDLYESYVAKLRGDATVSIDEATLGEHTIDAVRPVHVGASPNVKKSEPLRPTGTEAPE